MSRALLHRQSGFTIIELVIVISVIAILAAVIVISYGNWQASLKANAIKNDLNAVASLMESERNFSSIGSYPTSEPTFTRSANVTINFTSLAADQYCIDGFATDETSIKYYMYSKTKEKGPQSGDCATKISLTPPSAPSVSVGSPTSSSVVASWVAVTDATSYIAQCASDPAFIYNRVETSSTTGTTTISATLTGLPASSSVYCRAKAVNTKGASSWSSTASGTTTS